MASSGKRKTTMAKLMREAKLRERRVEKNVRKEERRRELEDPATAYYGPMPEQYSAEEASTSD